VAQLIEVRPDWKLPHDVLLRTPAVRTGLKETVERLVAER
jgi:hypothetical protein